MVRESSEKICVSVIIPVYNARKDLEKCLKSVLFQSLRRIEIICVDDGSTDGSAQILDAFARQDPRVRVVRQENAGAGAARNTGMRYAQGSYLSFLDADDFFEPDMLALAYEKALSADADIVVFRSDQYDDATETYLPLNYSIARRLLPQEEPFASTQIEKDIFKAFVGWAWDKLFRTQFVRESGLSFQPLRTSNDLLFTFSAVAKADRIVTMDDVLAHHRSTAGSLSVTREKSWDCFLKALSALRTQLEEWGLYERFEQDYINYCLHFSLWNVNTLRGKAYFLLYEALKETYLSDFGITDRDQDYFYNQYEYEQLQMLLTTDAQDALFVRIGRLRDERDASRRQREHLRARLERLRVQRDHLRAQRDRRTEQLEQVKSDREALRREYRSCRRQLDVSRRTVEELRCDLDEAQDTICRMRRSYAWRIGRAVTWIPGKLRGWFGKSRS